MRSIFSALVLIFLCAQSVIPTHVFASQSVSAQAQSSTLTYRDLLIMIIDQRDTLEAIPLQSEYISLKWRGLGNDEVLKEALKQGIFIGAFPNSSKRLSWKRSATEGDFADLAKRVFSVTVDVHPADRQTPLSREKASATIGQLTLPSRTQPVTPLAAREEFITLDNVYRTLTNRHFDRSSFTNTGLLQGAARGMAAATLDPYTAYLAPVDARAFYDEISESFEGIGASVEMTRDGLTIVSPLIDSPAERAGIRSGDVIMKAGEKDIVPSMSTQEAVSYIKGPAGTKVLLTIVRDGQVLMISVERAKIVQKYVESRFIGNDLSVRISSFNEGMSTDFLAALKQFAQQSVHSRLIIDLRNNPGWDVREALAAIAPLVSTTGAALTFRAPGVEENIDYPRTDFRIGMDRKVVVLVNRASASASEIMALLLREERGAVIIGEKTFGKGVVQTIENYSDGSSLKYTIADWVAARTRTSINKVGITPDQVVIDSGDAILNAALSSVK